MKTLITYYTRTGNTRMIGQALAKELGADIDEIVDERSRKGIIGYLRGGIDAHRKKLTTITTTKKPSSYDLIIIGTPVWAGTMTPAARTYLATHQFKNVAFFSTYGGSPGKTFTEMELLSKRPVATLGLKQNNLDDAKAIKDFCEKLSKKKRKKT